MTDSANGLKNPITYTAPTVGEAAMTEANIGLYAMEKARRNAFT